MSKQVIPTLLCELGAVWVGEAQGGRFDGNVSVNICFLRGGGAMMIPAGISFADAAILHKHLGDILQCVDEQGNFHHAPKPDEPIDDEGFDWGNGPKEEDDA